MYYFVIIQGDTMLTTSTELDVMMGERRPEVGKVRKQEESKLSYGNNF